MLDLYVLNVRCGTQSSWIVDEVDETPAWTAVETVPQSESSGTRIPIQSNGS